MCLEWQKYVILSYEVENRINMALWHTWVLLCLKVQWWLLPSQGHSNLSCHLYHNMCPWVWMPSGGPVPSEFTLLFREGYSGMEILKQVSGRHRYTLSGTHYPGNDVALMTKQETDKNQCSWQLKSSICYSNSIRNYFLRLCEVVSINICQKCNK